MVAEYVFCSLTSPKKIVLLRQPIKKDGLLRQPIACYEIAYDYVMTYVGNRTINMTLVMLFLVGNKKSYLQYDGVSIVNWVNPHTLDTDRSSNTRANFGIFQ